MATAFSTGGWTGYANTIVSYWIVHAGHRKLNTLTYAVRGKVVLKYTAQLILIQAILVPVPVPVPVMVIGETWWHDTWGRAVFFQLCENAAFPRTDHRRGYRGQ